MNAQEIFEKLEFKLDKIRTTNKHIYYLKGFKLVHFDLTQKTFRVLDTNVSIELYRAITQQMKELGWL